MSVVMSIFALIASQKKPPFPHWDTIIPHLTLSAFVEALSTAGTKVNPLHHCSTTSKAAEVAELVTVLVAHLPLLSCSIPHIHKNH